MAKQEEMMLLYYNKDNKSVHGTKALGRLHSSRWQNGVIVGQIKIQPSKNENSMRRNAGSDVSEVAEMIRATKMKETGWQWLHQITVLVYCRNCA
eukprot:12633863-Ditylum_brightwellii.AAC.2